MSNNKSDATFHGGEIHPAYSKPKKKKRIFMWFFLAIQLLFVIWVIAGLKGQPTVDQSTCGGLDLESCNAASDLGTGIGLALVLGLWAFVDFILVVVWAVVTFSRRR